MLVGQQHGGLEIEDGGCLDDIIAKYLIAGKSMPPMPDESVWHWLTRVKLLANEAKLSAYLCLSSDAFLTKRDARAVEIGCDC